MARLEKSIRTVINLFIALVCCSVMQQFVEMCTILKEIPLKWWFRHVSCLWKWHGYFSANLEWISEIVKELFNIKWTASSEFGTYRLCEQRRFRRACASAQSRQNLCCSLIQAVSQEEPSDRKPDPWPLWMAGHVHLKFVMTECSRRHKFAWRGSNEELRWQWNSVYTSIVNNS